MKQNLIAYTLALTGLFLSPVLNRARAESARREPSQTELSARAKISEAKAREIALTKAPGGKIQSSELEEENGKLIWSFDIATTGTKNITEVNVDAIDGAIVGVDIETPKDEKNEAAAEAPATATYHVAETFHLGGTGSWDYLTVDAEHQLLFVPRSTHTMVVDAKTGHVVADMPGQKRNHGVALVPSAGRGFITDGDDASVFIFDLKTYRVLGRIAAEKDADGVIYDPASKKVLLVSGDGGVLIPLSPDVDPANGKADAAVDLGGKPEFLAADGKGKAFINLMDKNQVAVVNTKTMTVEAHWSTAPGGSPVGMSMDREHRRLFIGCRKPQKLIVMDANNGNVIADLPIGAGVDATQFDGDAFASCADGTLAVARETSAGKFEVIQTVTTPRAARTMGLDAKNHALYLPTAEFEEAKGKGRPPMKPGTFMVVKVTR